MALSSNQLTKIVDLPVWEWTRPTPVASTGGVTATCIADNQSFNPVSGRFIYFLINATNFWRYDTIADTYEQLATPSQAPLTATSMRFAGAQGYYNRVISATSTTVFTGLPSGQSAVGYKIRIVSGRGAGQERLITAVSDPVVADYGAAISTTQIATATAGAFLVGTRYTVATIGTTDFTLIGGVNTVGSTFTATGVGAGTGTAIPAMTMTDTSKTWTTGLTGTTINVNSWVGYVVRTLFGTGAGQVRKILYNSATVLTLGDVAYFQNDMFSSSTMTAPTAGTVYQIEASTITVDTAWDVTPDSTSRYVIQSGGIWMISGAAAAPFYTLQYYDVLNDVWYSRTALTNMVQAVPTDVSLERVTENSTLWVQGTATAGTTTTLQDNTQNWAINQWAGYELYFYSGTGRGQVAIITSNTANTLTFPTITTAPNATTQYNIVGFDGGRSTGSNTNNTLVDTTKSWTVNRWSNYAVRILAGTGAGQVRRILSNTSTALTIIGTWNILPDSTSVYTIQGDSDTMYIGWGGSAETFMHNTNIDMLSHGRAYDSGIACVACALLSDVNHTIYDYQPYAITSLAGTTTITATTSQAHNLKVGQYVSIRGVTSAANDQFNVTGLVQIASVPSVTTFTYTPSAAGSGTYAYLTALGTGNLSDASKDFRDNISSATTTSLTFTRTTPSNINGWYVSGTNITPGTTIASGAGTTTLTLSATQAGTPSGVMTFSPWGPVAAIASTFSSGGGAGVATVTFTANTNANITGWYAVGTGIAIGATVTGGAGTATLTFSTACTGAVSGNVSFYPPSVAGRQIVMSVGVPTLLTGNTTVQLMQATTSGVGGGTMGFIAALGTAPFPAYSRYVVCDRQLLGAALDQTLTTYNAGVATGGSTTTLVDSGAFWATATGTGAAQGTTVTLSAAAPGNVNGWYVSGTGIGAGAQIVSGQGTTTLTLSVPHTGAVSGTISCQAWNQSLVGRRIKIQSGATGLNQELIITVVAPTTGTLTFATATAPVNGVAVYSILSQQVRGAGANINWISGNSVLSTKGRYLISSRAGAVAGATNWEKLDLTTDRVIPVYAIPAAETLGAGSMYAYDGVDKIVFTKDVTQRCYYYDVNTNIIYGAGLFPYAAGTAAIGNRLEIITTSDNLKYIWLNRQGQVETFRQLIFY